jgi:hypothetical protein
LLIKTGFGGTPWQQIALWLNISIDSSSDSLHNGHDSSSHPLIHSILAPMPITMHSMANQARDAPRPCPSPESDAIPSVQRFSSTRFLCWLRAAKTHNRSASTGMTVTQKIRNKTVNRTDRLTRFEKLQLAVAVTQTLVFLATLLAAVWIGMRQNQINKQLLDLNFRLSLEIAYDKGHLNIYNKGKENVWIWGSQFADKPVRIDASARLIVPGGSYYLLTDRLQNLMQKQLGADGAGYFPWNIFVATENGKKYTAQILLLVKMVGGEMTVHTQTVGFVESNWGE